MRTFSEVIRLMMAENERLMKLGYRHMNEAEMRWILGGIARQYEAAFDQVCKEIRA